MSQKISEEAVLDDLEVVAEETDGPISKAVYDEYGSYHPSTVQRRCGSLFEALWELDLEHRINKAPNNVDDRYIIEDIQRVAEEIGQVPSRDEYDEKGIFSDWLAENRFGSWTAAREAAGLDGGPTKNEYIPEADLTDELQRVADKVGESPSQKQFNTHGKWTHQVVYERFGSWNNGLKACGLDTQRDDRIPDEQLLSDIRRVAEVVGSVPSQHDYHERGEHGLSVVKRRFGNWATAVRKAGFEPRTVGAPTGDENPAWEGGYDPYYGPNWYEQREKARERDGYECRACGLTDEEHKANYDCELEMHHIQRAGSFDDYEKMNQLDNLLTLCTPCHQTYESLPNGRAKELVEG
jgi:hypothetical protein